MSKIIAFPKNRCYERQAYTRAKTNARQPSTGRSPAGINQPAARPVSVEPIWNSSAHGLVMSVVVQTCNRPGILSRCLAALVNQTLDRSRYEIIVVDDDPNDATKEIVEQWESQALTIGPRIFYIPSDGPHGPAAARNRGWHAARGIVIAFTDDDTIPYPDWLAQGLKAFDGIVQAVWGRVVMPLPGLPTDYEQDAKNLEKSEFVTANCFCLKRVLEDLGGFDERFNAWREDSDLYFRMLQGNISVSHAPEAVVEYPVRPATWGVSLFQQKRIQFDALLYKKHPLLYREKIRPSARWDYYAIVTLLVLLSASMHMQNALLAALSATGWTFLTTRFCLQRLRGTAKSVSHVAEMLVTSILIPPLAIFWRVVGAIRFRTGFL